MHNELCTSTWAASGSEVCVNMGSLIQLGGIITVPGREHIFSFKAGLGVALIQKSLRRVVVWL